MVVDMEESRLGCEVSVGDRDMAGMGSCRKRQFLAKSVDSRESQHHEISALYHDYT